MIFSLIQAKVEDVLKNPTKLFCTGLVDLLADTIWTCSLVTVQALSSWFSSQTTFFAKKESYKNKIRVHIDLIYPRKKDQ